MFRRLIYLSLRGFNRVQQVIRERFTPAGWTVAAAAGVGAAAGIDTNQTVSYQVFTLCAALIAVAAAWAPFMRARFEVRRELPRYATAGEPFTYDVTVANRGARALADARLLEHFADPRPSFAEWMAAREPGEARRNVLDRWIGFFRWQWCLQRRLPRRAEESALARLAPGETRTLKLAMTPRRRGRIELAGLTLARVEPLGLVRRPIRVAAPARITALPRRYRVPQIALAGARKFQQGGVSLAASIGDSEEFVGLRDYRDGDPLHKVHWKSFARRGRPVVKEFQDEFFERHALLLDTGRAAGEDEVFEEAVAIAASFVFTVDTRECLLDLLFVGGEVHAYTTGRGQTSPEHLLEVLAGITPSGPAEFAALARVARGRAGRISSCIVVLVEWNDERRALVESLLSSGLQVRAMLVCEQKPSDAPSWLRILHPGEVEAGLARMK
jgi:uncharacterized protein (DUF58 family)